MKKFKKILTAITTTAISAASLCSMFSASADTTQLKTFRIFHKVAVNSNIAYFDYTINYSSIVTATPKYLKQIYLTMATLLPQIMAKYRLHIWEIQ